MKLISATRRTDIPAFYTAWFLRRIREGNCDWVNPFGGQVYRVSLRPEDCLGIVFWTRFPAPLLPHLKDLAREGYHFYFQYTINGYPPELESHNPKLNKAIDAFRALADKISPDLVFWRYDPIILSDRTPASCHLENFEELAKQLEGHTRRCYFSFVSLYRKTERNLRRAGVAFHRPTLEEQRDLVRQLRDLAAPRGITLYSCCGDDLVGEGVEKARCVDSAVLLRRRPELDVRLKPRPTRPGCGCIESVDIGAYDTCAFGCTYCYATNSRQSALARLRSHHANSTVL